MMGSSAPFSTGLMPMRKPSGIATSGGQAEAGEDAQEGPAELDADALVVGAVDVEGVAEELPGADGDVAGPGHGGLLALGGGLRRGAWRIRGPWPGRWRRWGWWRYCQRAQHVTTRMTRSRTVERRRRGLGIRPRLMGKLST